ncbi:MAG: glycosyltransferase [Candidatus Aenigmarchaeota archaeon]|nr:glycosyltransferase [Candidatus Aenigmarchaeota archaeon]
MKQKFSVIIVSDNESNTGKLVSAVATCGYGGNFVLNKIFVVTCGNTDIDGNEVVIVIKEAVREGKASAINKALKLVEDDIIVLASADISINDDTIQNLLRPLSDLSIGMSCGRPFSNDDPKTFVGFLNSMVWNLHHFVSVVVPKGGELVAFRKIMSEIPRDIAADEAYIESEIARRGYGIAYVPSAITGNYGPVTLPDFITQRRRIFSGHLQVRNLNGYTVSTANYKIVLKALMKYLELGPKNLKSLVRMSTAIVVEAYSRFLGFLDYYTNNVMFVWPRYKRGDENVRIDSTHSQVQPV